MHEQTIASKVKSLTIEVGDLGHLPVNEMKEII